MPKNTLISRTPTIEPTRAIEIVCVVLTSFGPMDQGVLLERAMMVASDKFRRIRAGIDKCPKRLPPVIRVSEVGFFSFLGGMISDGIVERVDDTDVVRIISPVGVAEDDGERIDQLKMVEARRWHLRSRNEGGK